MLGALLKMIACMIPADSILRQRHFVLFALARLCSALAAQMQTVAVGWHVYQKSGDPLDLGLIGLSQFAPFLIMILPAGYAADHFNRQRILLASHFLQAICAVAMVMYSATHTQAIWPVFAIMTMLGVVRAFSMPVYQALLPQLVSSPHLVRAVAINSTIQQVSIVFGPVLGGLLLLQGVQAVYVSVVVLTVLSVLLVLGIRGVTRPVSVEAAEGQLAFLFGGLRFVWRQPLILGAFSLDLVAVLFGGATALLPIYAADILHVGPTGLGVLRSASGVGAMCAAVWLSFKPLQRRVGSWMFGSVMMFGLAMVVFGASTHIVLSVLALVLAGASDMVNVFVRQYLLQTLTPDALRGRVGSVFAVFVGASNELGEFESGTTAAWWGPARAVMIGGGLTVALTLWWLRLFPALRRMDRFPEPHTAE